MQYLKKIKINAKFHDKQNTKIWNKDIHCFLFYDPVLSVQQQLSFPISSQAMRQAVPQQEGL